LHERKQKRPVIKGMYHLFLGNTVAIVLTGISSIAVARLLGPEQYGLYGLALVAPGYLYSVVQLNIPAAAVRYSSKYKSEGSRETALSFAYSTVLFQLFLALAAFLVSVPLSGLIATDLLKRPELTIFIPVSAASVIGVAMLNVTGGGLQGLGEMSKSALVSVVGSFVRLAVSVGLILAGFSVLGAVIGYTAAYTASGVTGLVLILSAYKHLLPRNFLRTIRTSLTYSLPLYAGSTLGLFLSPFQNTLLANYVSNQTLGGYFAGSNLTTIIGFLGTPIATALFPLFSSFGENKEGLFDAYASSVKYGALFLVPATLLVIALSRPIAAAIYGESYAFAGSYFAVLAAPTLLVGLGSLSQGGLLNGMGETRKSLMIGVVGSLVATGTSVFLIPLLGVYGLVLASAIGTTAGLVVSTRVLAKLFARSILVTSVGRIYVAGAIAAPVVYPLAILGAPAIPTVLGATLLFTALYVPLLALTKALTPKELSTLEVYFMNVGPFSALLGLLLRYYRIFARGQKLQPDPVSS